MKIAFTILGECMSMKNSRNIVMIAGRPAVVKKKKAQNYERDALQQIPPAARQMLTGPVRATIRLFYSTQRPDLDEALLLDVLAARYKKVKGKLEKLGEGKYQHGPSERLLVQKGVYVNDRQVREKHIFHGIDRANPRAEIEIETLEMQQADLIGDELEQDEDEAEGVPF